MPLKHCQYWIFDLDGTLTVAVHDFDAIRKQLGLPAGALILEALNSLPAQQAEQILRRLNEIEWQLARAAQPQPGAHELLAQLAEQGRQMGILTRNGAAIAKETLQVCGLAHYFCADHIIGRELCAPKPDPGGVTYLLDQWGATKSDTVMVGDYLFDMQAGHGAGVMTVHFDHSGEFAWPEFTDVKVTTLMQLMQLCQAG